MPSTECRGSCQVSLFTQLSLSFSPPLYLFSPRGGNRPSAVTYHSVFHYTLWFPPTLLTSVKDPLSNPPLEDPNFSMPSVSCWDRK